MDAYFVGAGGFADPCGAILDDQVVGAAVYAIYDEICVLI